MIAIVSLACRYADANSPEELWQNVLAQRRSFRRIPACRLPDAYFSSDDPDGCYARYAAVLEGYEFDRGAFGISGRAFRAADRAHWIALDVAAEAILAVEAALADRARVGVIVGNSLTGDESRANSLRTRWPYVEDSVRRALEKRGIPLDEVDSILADVEKTFKEPFATVNEETLAGGLANTIAGRICGHFDFGGGGYSVDGACASSLLAVISGCQSLRSGDLDAAIVGGVDFSLDPFELVGFARAGALSRTTMRVYDERSAGFWPGEGCGFAVLMREEDAVEKGLPVLATIQGWGMSSDGRQAITRPDSEGQAQALQSAYERFGLDPGSVSYFEGHGTGTDVGDKAEIEAILSLRNGSSGTAYLGSIKANIGHTKAAAGMAGLIKATQAVRAGLIPPATACERPNARLGEVLVVPSAPVEMIGPRRAGVSAMGFGGFNTHLVLEGKESCVSDAGWTSSVQDAELFLLSADSLDDVTATVDRLQEIALDLSFGEMADLSAALMARLRTDHRFRAAVVADSPETLRSRLEVLRRWLDHGARDRIDAREKVALWCSLESAGLLFLFSGQGTPVPASGGLWKSRFGSDWPTWESDEDEKDTRVAQPRILAAQLAALGLFDRAGITADIAVGHSLGEIAALRWAGALGDDQAREVVDARARAMGSLPAGGAMLAAHASVAEILDSVDLGEGAIACKNGPRQTILSGSAGEMDRIAAALSSHGIGVGLLNVSHAFHSGLMEPARDTLAAAVVAARPGLLSRPVYSTITGDVLAANTDIASLFADQLTSPVEFEAALAKCGPFAFGVEIGPGSVLAGLTAELVDSPIAALDVGSDSLSGLLFAIAGAFVLGKCRTPWALFEDRQVRPFDFETWSPRFFASPCERPNASQVSDHAVLEIEGESAIDLVRQVIASMRELPASSIADGDRLMKDLKLNSLMVAGAAARVSAELKRSIPDAPSALVSCTVREFAEIIERRPMLDARAEGMASGVAPWLREFEVVYSETLPTEAKAGPGDWRVIGPGRRLSERMASALGDAVGSGLVICFEKPPGPRELAELLPAIREEVVGQGRLVFVQEGEWVSAFAKSVFLDSPRTRIAVITIDASDPDGPIRAASEAGSPRRFHECLVDSDGRLRVPRLRQIGREEERSEALPDGALVIVSGGGKGIGFECAMALAESGYRLALIGRASPVDDRELSGNLHRMRAATKNFRYFRVDITESGACQKVKVEIEEWAKAAVLGVVHAAGENSVTTIERLTEVELERAWAAKVEGARNLLETFASSDLRRFVGFGSIIGRSGFAGSAAYAHANEALRRVLAGAEQTMRDCTVKCLDWSVWGETGMGRKLGVLDSMSAQGVGVIPVGVGVDAFLRAFHSPAGGATALISRLPELATISFAEAEPMISRFLEERIAFVPGVEGVYECVLRSPRDPYLAEHVLDGLPLFPAVMGLEAMVQAARDVAQTSEIPIIQNARFQRPIAVPPGQLTRLRISALRELDGGIFAEIRSDETNFGAVHFCCQCRFESPGTLPSATDRFVADIEADFVYDSLLFHTGRFRRLSGYREVSSTSCLAVVSTKVPSNSWFAANAPQELAIGDPGLNDATLHALQACIPQTRVLPVGIERIDCFNLAATPRYILARELADDGKHLAFDVETYDENGLACASWRGLKLARTTQISVREVWPVEFCIPRIERLARRFAPVLGLSVFIRPSEREASETKPPRGVSRTHLGGLVLECEAKGSIACDWAELSDRGLAILGESGAGLARLVAREVGEEVKVSSARVWAAKECLAKAGHWQNTALRLESHDSDAVVLAAGSIRIATISIELAKPAMSTVFAFLWESAPTTAIVQDIDHVFAKPKCARE